MKTLTTTLEAYLTEYSSVGPEDIKSGGPELVNRLTFWGGDCPANWTKVGTADVTVTFLDTDALVASKLDSLNAQLKKDQADSEVRQNLIREQIQHLLAITHQPDAVES